MIKEVIATGKTIEEAFEKACAELGVDTAKATMEVIEKPAAKILGLFGGSLAKVKAVYKTTPAETAADYIKVVLKGMGLKDVEVAITYEEDGAVIDLSGEDIGFIIGHRGETLDSLQYLASLVANHGEDKYYRITLDVGSFREKRKETLENLGKKMAARAVKTGRNASLEPMNPYERRIIHTAVQTVEGAKSWSEGEDLSRHVVIGPVDGERKPRYNNRRGDRYNDRGRNNGRGNNRGGNRGGRGRNNSQRDEISSAISETAPVPYSPAPLDPAPERKKAADAPLYGRIELTK